MVLVLAGLLTASSTAGAAHSGLWVGAVTVNKVSENGKGKDALPSAPTPTAAPLDLRVLLHVDGAATPGLRLLEAAVLMWRNGTTKACSDAPGSDCPCNGNSRVTCDDQPGHFVIVTDDTRISEFKGTDLRNGESVGRRISSAGYDFGRGGGAGELQTILGDGSLAADGTGAVSFAIVLAANDPANPFRHRYHPDHDEAGTEVPALTRSIELTFSSRYPADPDQPAETDEAKKPLGWGVSAIGGTYREVLSGLLRDSIELRGFFTLSRLAETATLNE